MANNNSTYRGLKVSLFPSFASTGFLVETSPSKQSLYLFNPFTNPTQALTISKHTQFVQYDEKEHEKLFKQLMADDEKKAKERRLEGKDLIAILITSREEAFSELAHFQIRTNKVALANKREVDILRIKISQAYDMAHLSYAQAQEYYNHMENYRKESERKDAVIQQSQHELVTVQAQLYQKTQEVADQQSQLDDAVAKNMELLAQLEDVRKKVDRIVRASGVLSPSPSISYDQERSMTDTLISQGDLYDGL
ncbi:hypothetical protein CaCOL14_003361 [Colletotrichum acutatum]|uniref:Uncharacterized protein n=1 Tax=Glomerella acutata TaxID=27357 RepID=A0AAD8UD89_GLOAC|nr:uncharacterized protein BDZ83DRAFT_655328 [Colletotrichum acutatum]KAK1717400.1 hypothetical protein BDZ83DRAFT_655328 [Colletotrichum acutatum]